MAFLCVFLFGKAGCLGMKQKKWFRQLFRHRVFVCALLLLQAGFMCYAIFSTGQAAAWINRGLVLVSLLVALHIVMRKIKGAYKVTWIFLILLFPLFGGLLYLIFTCQFMTRKAEKQSKKTLLETENAFYAANGVCRDAAEKAPAYETQVRYLQNCAGFPAFSHTQTQYYSPGEQYFEALLEALRGAKRYIFLEYFIIEEGVMWNSILEVLLEKVSRGVEVRLIYDDMGCFLLLPKEYAAFLRKKGIKTCVFNPFRPVLSTLQNNRDHRKIAVIDGEIAFTGGINLADEYINAIEKHGHWKDAGVRLHGAAAWGFAVIFLQMWMLCTKEQIDFNAYLPKAPLPESDGLVVAYADTPLDKENVCEHVYLQMINNAKRYVYINTPYLIIDDSMVSALCLAAKSGVDVKIVTPHKWDKRFVHFTTRSYYRELIAAGVQIYEYTAGFVHAKNFVCDDAIASIGTANLDFRSLYLHFECGALLLESRAAMQLAADFKAVLPQCKRIALQDCKGPWGIRLLEEVFRLFAPLM